MKLKTPNSRHLNAFSLVELMIVVAIIGTLSALALPKFQNFQARARQSESRTTLAHIWVLQESYQADNDTYWGLSNNSGVLSRISAANATSCHTLTPNGLGFKLTDCTKVRYQYRMIADSTTTTFTAQAKEFSDRVTPSCSNGDDTHTISEKRATVQTYDAIACPPVSP